MRRETTAAQEIGARRETLDASEARRETRDVRRVSSLSSCDLVSRLTSHAPTPWPKVKLGKEGGARHETIDASEARHETRDVRRVSSLSSCNLVSRLTSHAPAPWPKVKLGDVGKVVTGLTPPTKHSEYFGDRFLFVTPSDLRYDSYYIANSERKISDDGYTKFSTRFIPAGSVMYTCIASIGKVGISRSEVLTNQQINSIVPNVDTDCRFLYYLLRHLTPNIQQQNAGCAVPIINKGDFESFQIPIPPLPVQRRIADVLSAYDDLIENNRRRIAILEETARLTYRKWFGGTEQGRTASLGEVCQTFGGGTPKTSVPDFWDGDVPWVVPTDITRNTCLAVLDTERKISEIGLQKSSAKMLPANAILMTSRASVGYFGIADFPVCTNQGFISIIPNDDSLRWYLLFNLMSRVEEIRSNAKGSTFPEISRARFRSMDVAIPDDNPLIEFNGVVEPLMQQVRILAKQNAALATARDMLLPRLMKGELIP